MRSKAVTLGIAIGVSLGIGAAGVAAMMGADRDLTAFLLAAAVVLPAVVISGWSLVAHALTLSFTRAKVSDEEAAKQVRRALRFLLVGGFGVAVLLVVGAMTVWADAPG